MTKWFTIALLIFSLSEYHNNYVKNNETYLNNCCNCQQYSKITNYKVEWSYCYNHNCDCDVCESYSINNTYPIYGNCNSLPVSNIFELKSRIDYRGCNNDDLSINFFGQTSKEYWYYGFVILISTIFYIIAMSCCYCDLNPEHIGINLFIYNIIWAVVASYDLYKTFQYYEVSVKLHETDNQEIVCLISAVHDWEDKLMGWLVYFALGLMGLMLLTSVVLSIIGCSRNCMEHPCDCFKTLMNHWFCDIWNNHILSGSTFIMVFVFLCNICYAMIKVIYYQPFKKLPGEFILIWFVDLLLLFNCFDIWCFPKTIRKDVLIPWCKRCCNQE